MKIIRKGNVYRKSNWLEEHKDTIYYALTVVLCLALFCFASLIGG